MHNSFTKAFLGTAVAASLLLATAPTSHALQLNTSALPDGDTIGGFFDGQTDPTDPRFASLADHPSISRLVWGHRTRPAPE